MRQLPARSRRRATSRAALLAAAAGLAILVAAAILVARAAFRRAPKTTAAPRAPSQQDAEATREQNAETLFRSAKAAIEARHWPLARDELTRLEQDWSHTRFYAAHRAAIEEMARTISAAAPAATPPAPPAPVESGVPAPKAAVEGGPQPGKPDYEYVFKFGPTALRPAPRDDAPDAWRRRMARAMQKQVTFHFVETPFQDVANFVSSLVDETIILDPRAARALPNITLRVEQVPLQGAFTQICKLAALERAEVDGVILLATEARLKEIEQEAESVRLALKPPTKELAGKLARRATFDFVETPLWDVANFLSSLVDMTIVFDPEFAKDAATVTLRVDELRLDQSLLWISFVTRCAMAWRDGALFISSPQRVKAGPAEDEALRPAQGPPTKELAEKLAKRITFDFVETPLPDVVAFLIHLTGLPLVADAASVRVKDAPNVTLRVGDMPADAAIRWCCRVSGLACIWLDGKLVITTPERARAEAAQRKRQ